MESPQLAGPRAGYGRDGDAWRVADGGTHRCAPRAGSFHEVLPILPPVQNPVNFAHPPVGEVALAVQFSEPVVDELRAVGSFWPLIKDRYPIARDATGSSSD